MQSSILTKLTTQSRVSIPRRIDCAISSIRFDSYRCITHPGFRPTAILNFTTESKSSTKTTNSSTNNNNVQVEKVKVEACGDVDSDDEDEMELEEMFVDAYQSPSFDHRATEWGGPRRGGRLPEPTRFGDWERKGRCSDF